MINNFEGYLCGMPVIIAEHTIRVRNKTHKIKFIDRIYEKIYGWSEIACSSMPEGTDAFVFDSGDGKVLYVRNREVLAKIEEAVTKDVLKYLDGGVEKC